MYDLIWITDEFDTRDQIAGDDLKGMFQAISALSRTRRKAEIGYVHNEGGGIIATTDKCGNVKFEAGVFEEIAEWIADHA